MKERAVKERAVKERAPPPLVPLEPPQPAPISTPIRSAAEEAPVEAPVGAGGSKELRCERVDRQRPGCSDGQGSWNAREGASGAWYDGRVSLICIAAAWPLKARVVALGMRLGPA